MATVYIPDKLRAAAVEAQQKGEVSVPVRDLLYWFWGSQRRGRWIVAAIRDALEELKVATSPDFDSVHIDGVLSIVPLKSAAKPKGISEATSSAGRNDSGDAAANAFEDPTYRIGRLKSATATPTTVSPDATLEEAITLMLTRDYSQLPVMTSERDIKGVVSWKSIGTRLALGKQCTFVRECMDPHNEVTTHASLFSAINQIVEHDFVVVRDPDTRKIVGIVTTSDLSVQFRQLSEPYLLLGEIENQIRTLIAERFSLDELKAARNPNDTERSISDITDLSFGEYIWLLQSPDNWKKLNIRIDRNTFVVDLEKIRDIRNDVMHFDPDPVGDAELNILRDFARCLQRLQQVNRA